jgi:hypothetical protein
LACCECDADPQTAKEEPPLSIVFCFHLSAIGEVLAMLRDANLLVQLAFAFAGSVCASCLKEAGPRRRPEKRHKGNQE